MRVLQRFILFICLLLPTLVLATHGGGDNGGDFWVDGPAEVQPGVDRNIPDVSIDKFGRSIYVWYAFGSVGGDRNDVFLRRFDAAGEPLKDPVMVNTSTEDDQFFARVAVSEDGSFLVVWQSDEPDSEVNVDRKFVRSQAFDADANPVGSELLVNTLLTGEAVDISADVAALKGGGYVVVWTTPEVHGRKFKADGTPVGDDFQINTFTTGAEAETDVVLGFGDQLLVVWKDSDVNAQSIQGRIVTGSDQFHGAQFQLNAWITGAQQLPGIGGRDGNIAIAWRSPGNVETDKAVIVGQIWSLCGIYCDGFE
jgi:hypothetical protein